MVDVMPASWLSTAAELERTTVIETAAVAVKLVLNCNADWPTTGAVDV